MNKDKTHIKQRFSAALPHYDKQAVAQQQINQTMLQLLQNTQRQQFERVLEIGCGSGNLTRRLVEYCQVKQWILNDLCDSRAFIQAILQEQDYQFHCGDAEQFEFDGQYDLITSASTVQWFHAPQEFLHRCCQHLSPNGVLLISTFAPHNLYEVRATCGVGLDYPTVEQWQNWLSQHIQYFNIWQQDLRYQFSSPLDVLLHLKHSGVTATAKNAWTKRNLREFSEKYSENYSSADGKGVYLTYAPIIILAQKNAHS